MKFIGVKDFESFQHYKGRTPPWIKFYNALLDDYKFLQLSDAARSQLMLIWLVASRHQNRIPNDPQFIARAIHCTTKLQLSALIESGWLYQSDEAPLATRKQDASKPLAECSTSAIPEVEEERETEKETEKISNSSEREALLQQVPEQYRPDLEAFLRGVGDFARQRSWIRSMEAHLSGDRPPRVSGETLGSCIRQFVANGAQPNWRLFERYLLTETAPKDSPRSASRSSGKTLAATQLIAAIRKRRNPLFPQSVNADWQEGLTPHEVGTAKAFGVQRILNDTNEGTLVSQLARALEENHTPEAIPA